MAEIHHLCYSAKTTRENNARATAGIVDYATMTTTQRERVNNAFKKYVVRTYKEEEAKGRVMDGTKELFSDRRAYSAHFYNFWYSPERKAVTFLREFGVGHDHSFSDEDIINIYKKTKTALTKSGYKCEIVLNEKKLLVWKEKRRR